MERASMLKSGELFQADGANAEALLWGTSSKKPSLIASLPDTRAHFFNTNAQKNPKSPKSEGWTHSIFYTFILYLFIACVWKHGGSGVEGWLEDNSFHHVGPRDWTQGVRLGCKLSLSLLSHPTSPKLLSLRKYCISSVHTPIYFSWSLGLLMLLMPFC